MKPLKKLPKLSFTIICCGIFLVISSFDFAPKKHIKLWLIGDSTMANYAPERGPITGWGMPFTYFFDTTVTVCNRAAGGRSTRTFISEQRWQHVADSLEPGDYVMMQFGHNDEAKEPIYKDRYTPVPDYKTNLIRFITETRNKKAFPVLITPVTRMVFDTSGRMKETHAEYTAAVLEIGAQYNVPVIDLDKKSRELLNTLGPQTSKMLFMQLDSLENPHYPAGQKDNTHFNEYGARRIAEIVLKEMRAQQLDLNDRIIKK